MRPAPKHHGAPPQTAVEINEAAFEYYPRLAKVKRHVEAASGHYVSLKEAAGVACLEAKYFSAFFRTKVGVPYTRWETTVRIQKAVAILASTDESVSLVASMTGFRHVRTFERAFKRLMRVTPLEFKMQVRP